MGAWGPGLYSNDYALDLKPMVRALLRLPLEPEAIVARLVDHWPESNDAENEDHTTFWLVIADMFTKAGLANARVTETVRNIVRTGADTCMMRELDMAPRDIAKRERMVAAMLAALEQPASADTKPRKVISKPQPLLFAPGDIFTFPTANNMAKNPYFPPGYYASSWKDDGWHGGIVLLARHAFDYFAWYGVLYTTRSFATKPTLDEALGADVAYLWHFGTAKKSTLNALESETIGKIEIHPSHLDDLGPALKAGENAAASESRLSFSYRPDFKDTRLMRALGEPEVR